MFSSQGCSDQEGCKPGNLCANCKAANLVYVQQQQDKKIRDKLNAAVGINKYAPYPTRRVELESKSNVLNQEQILFSLKQQDQRILENEKQVSKNIVVVTDEENHVKDLTEEEQFLDLKNEFFMRHREKFSADAQSWCGLYCPRTSVKPDSTMQDILDHALKNKRSRSRAVCVDMELIDENGGLTKKGEIIKARSFWKSIKPLSS